MQISDQDRLDWLEKMDVNVRVPCMQGSESLFCAGPTEDIGELSDLRRQIDRGIRKAAGR